MVIYFLSILLVSLSSSTQAYFVEYQNYEYLSTIKLNDYLGYYGNVKLSRYHIPIDVLSATWKLQFIATEGCPATRIYFYLDYAGFPVISPHNQSFPQYFTKGRLTKLYLNETISGKQDKNSTQFFLSVVSPKAGYWFSASFYDSNTDPGVKPEFMQKNCSFYLTSSVNLWVINDTTSLYPDVNVNSTSHSIYKMYKYSTDSTYAGPLEFYFEFDESNSSTKQNCSATILLKQLSFPDMVMLTNNNDYVVCNKSQKESTTSCRSLSIQYPLRNSLYYVGVTSKCSYRIKAHMNFNCSFQPAVNSFNTINSNENKVPLAMKSGIAKATFPDLKQFSEQLQATSQINESNRTSDETYKTTNLPRLSLFKRTVSELSDSLSCNLSVSPIEAFRFIGPSYFAVKYYFNSNYNRSNTLLVQHDRRPYFFEFLVDIANHGGTLNFYMINNLVLDPSYSNQFGETEFTSTPSTASFNSTNTTNASSTTTSPLNNKYLFAPTTQTSEFNLTNIKFKLRTCLLHNSMTDYLNCPEGYGQSTHSYPNLYTSLQLNVAYPKLGQWYLAVWKECYDAKTNESIECPSDYVPYVNVQMNSDQCANDYCGEYGTCYIINSQLNVVSACKCRGGYSGYGCSDGKNAVSPSLYLASTLFLTLSNLFFLVPIIVALTRRWYIESLVYFYNMFFSTFYHACDQEFYSMCIFNYDGLQLADFISSYTSFVITILTMSVFPRPIKVFAFFVGLLACLSINLYDRFNYIAFIIFILISLSVTIFTWVRICYTQRRLYPKRKTLLKYYLPGSILAIVGLLIYSFFQTKSNYWILHSIWHTCMAISIIFFLPKRDKSQDYDLKKEIIPGETKGVIRTTSSLNDSTLSGSTNSTSASNKSSTSTVKDDQLLKGSDNDFEMNVNAKSDNVIFNLKESPMSDD